MAIIQFDFRNIQTMYPKAFELLKVWIAKEEIIYKDSIELLEGEIICATGGTREFWSFNPLELDFFFDEQGIHGSIHFIDKSWGQSVLKQGDDFWVWEICTLKEIPQRTRWDSICSDDTDRKNGRFLTRPEALQALWTREFQILEERVK